MTSPVKMSWKTELFPIILIIISIALSFFFYANWPAQVVSHWNFYGQPDAYSSKGFMAFFFPILLAAIYFVFLVFPALDPKKDRYAEFSKVYGIFRSGIIAILFILYVATGLYNLGYDFNVGYVAAGVIGLLMIIIGNYMGKIKPNWFMGIRTPWTLSSENVWTKTHRVGGWMFIIFGLLIIIAPYLPAILGLIAFIAGVVLVLAGTLVYSYIVYRQEKK